MTLPPLLTDDQLDDIAQAASKGNLFDLRLASNAAIAAVPAQPVLDCDIQPRPLAYPLTDYHRAGIDGPLHYTWQDKPHRLLYDLIAAVRYYAAPQAAPAQRQPLPTGLRLAAAFTRSKLVPGGDDYPHLRELLAFAEQALGITAAPAAQKGEPT